MYLQVSPLLGSTKTLNNTVKLIYKDHHRDKHNVVVIRSWSLYAGSITWKDAGSITWKVYNQSLDLYCAIPQTCSWHISLGTCKKWSL